MVSPWVRAKGPLLQTPASFLNTHDPGVEIASGQVPVVEVVEDTVIPMLIAEVTRVAEWFA